LLLLRMTRLLRLLNLIAPLLALRLHLLLRGRALLLLRLNHLLPSSFTLRLLLLTLHLFLVLRTNRLAYRLTLRLHRCAFRRPRVSLLFAQVLQLLTGVPITPRCLSRQVRYLALARLLSRNVARLS